MWGTISEGTLKASFTGVRETIYFTVWNNFEFSSQGGVEAILRFWMEDD